VVLIADEEESQRLPFDIAQMRIIFFDHTDLESAAKCRDTSRPSSRRRWRAQSTLQSVQAWTLQGLESGTAVERTLAELVSRVED
jgi:hypothetical protein